LSDRPWRGSKAPESGRRRQTGTLPGTSVCPAGHGGQNPTPPQGQSATIWNYSGIPARPLWTAQGNHPPNPALPRQPTIGRSHPMKGGRGSSSRSGGRYGWRRWRHPAPRPVPCRERSGVSSSSSMRTPQASSPRAIASIRSLSLTRSSFTPRITVLPSAKRRRPPTGSDIRRSCWRRAPAAPRRPASRLNRTRRSATGSPPSSRVFQEGRCRRPSRPASGKARSRVGFWLTPGTGFPSPHDQRRATGKAAEDGSRGTATVCGRSSGRPVRVMTCGPRPSSPP
jgi:hypothetical protein